MLLLGRLLPDTKRPKRERTKPSYFDDTLELFSDFQAFMCNPQAISNSLQVILFIRGSPRRVSDPTSTIRFREVT